MALSQRAELIVKEIDAIANKYGLHAVLPKLTLSVDRKVAHADLVIETPRVSKKGPVSFEGDEIAPPKTPAVMVFRKTAPKESLATSAFAEEALTPTESSKSEAYHLLNQIKSRIVTFGDEYLKFDSLELDEDIEAMNKLLNKILTLKSGSFKMIRTDFINLIAALKPRGHADRESAIFERHVESSGNLEVAPLIIRREASREAADENEPSCYNPFARCRSAFSCQ